MIDTPAIEKLLGELERLGAAATPGPWEVSCSEVGIGPDTRPIAFLEHEGSPFLVDEEPEAMDVISHDLEFIAEMRASLPTLITTIRALMEAVEEQKAERALLQDILDSRPAINAGLPESYVRWSQAIYSGEIFRAAIRSKGDA